MPRVTRRGGTVELHGSVDDALRGASVAKSLAHGDLGPSALPLVPLPRGAEDEEARGVELGQHLGEGDLRELHLGQTLPELLANLHARGRVLERRGAPCRRRQRPQGRPEDLERAEREGKSRRPLLR